jgi:transcriptional regulator with AAA-type ATPase domain/mevalonate kinase
MSIADFFDQRRGKIHIITQTAGIALLCGEHSLTQGGLAVCFAPSCPVYIALEQTDGGGIKDGSVWVYDYGSKIFKDKTFEIASKYTEKRERIIHFINNKIKTIASLELSDFIIHEITCLPPGRGVNYSGALSLGIVASLFFLNDRMNSDVIETWKSTPINELKQDEKFDQLFRFVWCLDTIAHDGSASGYGASSIASIKEPFFTFYTEKRGLDEKAKPYRINVFENDGLRFILPGEDAIQYELNGLSQFVGDPAYTVSLPLLFGLIDSGIEKDTGLVIEQVRSIGKDIENAYSPILEDYFHHATLKSEYWLSDFAHMTKEQWFQKYYECLNISNLQIFYELVECLKHRMPEELERLAKKINGTSGILKGMGLNWREETEIINALEQSAQSLGIYNSLGAKLTGAGRGGSIVFAIPVDLTKEKKHEAFLQLVKKNVSRLHYSGYPIRLYWDSYSSSFETNGLSIYSDVDQAIDEILNHEQARAQDNSFSRISQKLHQKKSEVSAYLDEYFHDGINLNKPGAYQLFPAPGTKHLERSIPYGETGGKIATFIPNIKESIKYCKMRSVRSIKCILIMGEMGTGKDVVAEIIGKLARPGGEYLAINCSAIPEGLLEEQLFGHVKGIFTGAFNDKDGLLKKGHGGTVFLDEIGEMPVRLQPKLLRFLDAGKVLPLGGEVELDTDVLIVAATSKVLETEISRGMFRPDLYSRFGRRIPTIELRETWKDIPFLLHYFVDLLAKGGESLFPKQITRNALELLCAYEWPGNLRELISWIENTVVKAKSEVLKEGDIRFEDQYREEKHPKKKISKEALMAALETADNNKSEAAKMLGISRTTLYKWLR